VDNLWAELQVLARPQVTSHSNSIVLRQAFTIGKHFARGQEPREHAQTNVRSELMASTPAAHVLFEYRPDPRLSEPATTRGGVGQTVASLHPVWISKKSRELGLWGLTPLEVFFA
jgi:hypothetical protein